MRKLLLIPLLLLGTWAGATACPTGYAWTATIIVKHNASLSADVTNWPEVFTCGNTVCKTTGNGGQVTDAGAKDVVFCTGASGGTILTYELVPSSYSATAGTAEWWILIPTISKTADQTIHAVIGKASPTDFSCNQNNTVACTALYPNGISVQHTGYDNGTTNAQVIWDSVGNVTGINHSSTAVVNVLFPPVNEGMSTNGAAGWYDTGVTPNAGINGSFWGEFWISNADTTSGHTILGNVQTSNVGGFNVSTYISSAPCSGANKCIAIFVVTNASNFQGNVANFDLGTSGWHHVGFTHTTGTAGLVTIYIDGVSRSTSTAGGSGTAGDPGNSTSPLQIGKGGTADSLNWSGSLDEIHLGSTTLTADQDLSDYTFQNNPTSQYVITAAAATTPTMPPVVY